jgi:hypothetical protein
MAMCCAEMRPYQDTLQSTRGRGRWDPNGRSQSTGLQAFPSLPADAALGRTKPTFRTCNNCGPNDGPQMAGYYRTKYRRNAPLQSTKNLLLALKNISLRRRPGVPGTRDFRVSGWRSARSCSRQPGFGLLGRNAAERAQKDLCLIHRCAARDCERNYNSREGKNNGNSETPLAGAACSLTSALFLCWPAPRKSSAPWAPAKCW